MHRLIIQLDDEHMNRLRDYARDCGQTPVEAAASLLGSALSAADHSHQRSAPALSSALDL